VYTANRHLRGSGESHGKQRRTKVSFDQTMMQALELLQLAKNTTWDEATLNSEKIKPIASSLSSYACLKTSVSQSVENSVTL